MRSSRRFTKEQRELLEDFTPFRLSAAEHAIFDCNGMAMLGVNGQVTDFDRAVVAALNTAVLGSELNEDVEDFLARFAGTEASTTWRNEARILLARLRKVKGT